MTLPNRFALTLLSREYKDSAIPQEMMIHKQTGQILIKTADGNVISYDSLSRLRNHINTATLVAYNLNVADKMYSLELDTIEFPEIILDGVNILTEPYVLDTPALSKLLISVDMDCVEVIGDQKLVEIEPLIQIEFNLDNGVDAPVLYSETFLLSENNTYIIEPIKLISLVDDITTYTLTLTNISIIRNPNVDAERQVKNIIHSILLMTKEHMGGEELWPLLLNL